VKNSGKGFGFWLAFQPSASVSAMANGASGRTSFHVRLPLPLLLFWICLSTMRNICLHSFAGYDGLKR